MLKFLKKMMKGTEEKESVSLDADELLDWAEKRLKDAEDEFTDSLKSANKYIDNKKERAEELLENLENAELRNAQIPVKEIQFMEGNRSLFLKNTMNFLYSMPVFEANSFLEAQEAFKESLQQLGRSNTRCFGILQHFFANETREISIQIRKIGQEIDSLLKQYQDIGIKDYKEAIVSLKQLDEKQDTISELEARLDSKRSELQSADDEVSSLMSRIEGLKSRRDYNDYVSLEKKKENLEENIDTLKKGFDFKFSSLEQAIKKFSRQTMDEKLADSMLESPSSAALQFGTVKLIKFLESLNKAIEGDKIELKDKKKAKALEALNKIDDDTVDSFLRMLTELKSSRARIDKELHNNSVMSDHSEISYKKEHAKKQAESLKDEIGLLKDKLEKAKRSISYDVIAKKLSKAYGADVNIIS